jgi:hypothetical protein
MTTAWNQGIMDEKIKIRTPDREFNTITSLTHRPVALRAPLPFMLKDLTASPG